jgi:quinol monooxygenase YgiN
MKKYGLHGALRAQPGQGAQLADILLEAARLMQEAKGCQLYLISKDFEEADQIWVTEVWESTAAHDQSLQDERVRALIARAMPLLATPPAGGRKLEVLGGAGLAPAPVDR